MHLSKPYPHLSLLLAAVVAVALQAPLHAAQSPGDELLGPADGAAPGAPANEAARARTRGNELSRTGMESVRRFNQDQARNATAIVDAAIAFAKAREQLALGKADAESIAAVQANLYWCKKQMNLDALKDYVALKGAEFKTATKHMDEVTAAQIDPAQAGAYLARAESFAKANPDDHLQIAIRFTEVAERFPGAPEGTKANKQAAAAVQAQMRAIQEVQLAARQTRFTKPKTVVAGKTALPSAQEQKEALAQISKFYAKAFAKRDNPAKARLARKLLEETGKNKGDPAVFHQMVSEAIRLASESEAYEPLLDGIELLAGTFAGVDALVEKQNALKRMNGKTVAVAIAKLLTESADPAANLTAGKWFCFTAHRWSDGLPMLTLGGDADLARIGGMEIATPHDAAEEVQLADAWFESSSKGRSKDEKQGMLTRAMYWYMHPLGQLSGLGKDRVVKRIAEIEKQLPLDLDNVDWNALTASQWDKLKGRMATVNARVDRFDPGIALAAGETVRVVPHPTDQWSIVLNSWSAENKKTSCNWRGYQGPQYFFRSMTAKLGALMVWIETGEKQNAGIVKGPGRVYFSPQMSAFYGSGGDRNGTMRVKLVAVNEEE